MNKCLLGGGKRDRTYCALTKSKKPDCVKKGKPTQVDDKIIRHYAIRVSQAVCGRHVHYRQSIGHKLVTGMWIVDVNCPECMATQEYKTTVAKLSARRLKGKLSPNEK